MPVKIGTWGGNGGEPRDMKKSPMRLTDITVCSDGERINSIKFTYMDEDGRPETEGPWGGSGGNIDTIELGSSEYVKELSGTFGPWGDPAAAITSLKFVIHNRAKPYEYGKAGPEDKSFIIPVEEGQICGFYGRSGDVLNAIGVSIHA